eukprot:3419484-Prymnesium_polylepis.1
MFLERAMLHPSRCFMLIQVDLLPATAQQALLRHVLTSRDSETRHNLHCVQTASTVLQAAHWITSHKDAHSDLRRVEAAAKLQRWVVGGSDIGQVTCVMGAAGAGKTHWAKKQLAEWKVSGMATFILSITEAFSIGEAAVQLHSAVFKDSSLKQCGLFFHINLG